MSIQTKNSFPLPVETIPTARDVLPLLPAEPGMAGIQALDVSRAVRKRLEPHPVFRSDDPELFERTAKFVADRIGEPIDPFDYLDYLAERGIRLMDIPQNAVRVNQLLGKWSGKLKKYLENEEGVTGQWFVLRDGLTYAPDAREMRIATRAKEMATGYKRVGPSSADEIRESIWNTPEPEPAREGLLPESELTPTQKKLLAYMSHISVKQAVDYPSADELAEKIAGATKSFTPEAVHRLFGGLIQEQFLFKYRKGDKDYVTTNANVAYVENQKRQPMKGKNSAPKRVLSAETAEAMLQALLTAGDEKHTPKKLWALMHEGTDQAPTHEQELEIKEIARALAKKGVLLAGTFKPKEDGVTRSSKREAFRVGLSAEQRGVLGKTSPEQLQQELQRLLK